MSKYVTPYKYAQLCGVSTQAIYSRIARGTLTVSVFLLADGHKDYIDTHRFPPGKRKPGPQTKINIKKE